MHWHRLHFLRARAYHSVCGADQSRRHRWCSACACQCSAVLHRMRVAASARCMCADGGVFYCTMKSQYTANDVAALTSRARVTAPAAQMRVPTRRVLPFAAGARATRSRRRLCLRGLLHARLAPVGAHSVYAWLKIYCSINQTATMLRRRPVARATARAAQMRVASCLCGMCTRDALAPSALLRDCRARGSHLSARALCTNGRDLLQHIIQHRCTCRRCARRVRARYSGCMCRSRRLRSA